MCRVRKSIGPLRFNPCSFFTLWQLLLFPFYKLLHAIIRVKCFNHYGQCYNERGVDSGLLEWYHCWAFHKGRLFVLIRRAWWIRVTGDSKHNHQSPTTSKRKFHIQSGHKFIILKVLALAAFLVCLPHRSSVSHLIIMCMSCKVSNE